MRQKLRKDSLNMSFAMFEDQSFIYRRGDYTEDQSPCSSWYSLFDGSFNRLKKRMETNMLK